MVQMAELLKKLNLITPVLKSSRRTYSAKGNSQLCLVYHPGIVTA